MVRRAGSQSRLILTLSLHASVRASLCDGFVLSPAARADLDGIWDYNSETWGSAQAERYILQISAACEGLASGRRKGRSAEDIRPGYLKYAVGSHLLFYRLTLDGSST